MSVILINLRELHVLLQLILVGAPNIIRASSLVVEKVHVYSRFVSTRFSAAEAKHRKL